MPAFAGMTSYGSATWVLSAVNVGGLIGGGHFTRDAHERRPFHDPIDPASSSQRCMVTDPTGTPLNVRRFDGKIMGALHNGEIVKLLRTDADPHGKPWAYVAYQTNGEGWVYREFIQLLLRVTRARASAPPLPSAKA
jgi:hypothetical protein